MTRADELAAVRFDRDSAQRAADEWGFNCGPGALCAVYRMTPDDIRPKLADFERKGYINPSMMRKIVADLPVPSVYRRQDSECEVAAAPHLHPWPRYGLARVQWEGPWTRAGVPMAASYVHTHWVGARLGGRDDREIFDINAIWMGGWIDVREWAWGLVPWLLSETCPRATGRWWLTHVVEVA